MSPGHSSTAVPSSPARRIESLPVEAVQHLRSSVAITDFASVIVELVHNALDARASKVEISIHASNWECKVADDGVGIKKEDLSYVGRRYCW